MTIKKEPVSSKENIVYFLLQDTNVGGGVNGLIYTQCFREV